MLSMVGYGEAVTIAQGLNGDGPAADDVHCDDGAAFLEEIARLILEERLGSNSSSSFGSGTQLKTASSKDRSGRYPYQTSDGAGPAVQPLDVDELVRDIDSFWRNGNSVAIEILLCKPESDDVWSDPRERAGQFHAGVARSSASAVVLEVWSLALLHGLDSATGAILDHNGNISDEGCDGTARGKHIAGLGGGKDGSVDGIDDATRSSNLREQQKLLVLALRSFLHFSPLNAWILKNKSLQECLRCRLVVDECSSTSRDDLNSMRDFEPIRSVSSEFALKVHYRPKPPPVSWFGIKPPSPPPTLNAESSSTANASITAGAVRVAQLSPHGCSIASSSLGSKRSRPEHFASTPPNPRRLSISKHRSVSLDNNVVAPSAPPRDDQKSPEGFNRKTGLPISSSPDPRKRQINLIRSAPIPIGGSLRTSPRSRTSSLGKKEESWDGTRNWRSIKAQLPLACGQISDSPPRKGDLSLALSPPLAAKLSSSSLTPGAACWDPQHRERNNSWGSGAAKLLGSYEESLLTGRMSNWQSSKVMGFKADLGACGAGKTPPHVTLPLEASFYKIPGESTPSPYVGVINFDSLAAEGKYKGLKNGRYRIPAKGLVQLMIHNPEKTGIKVFVVKYDFRKMPGNTTTFLRQRTLVEVPLTRAAPNGRKKTRLLYAVHLRFLCTKPGRVYLHKEIRVLFSHRAPDMSDKMNTITEGPGDPVFSPVTAHSSSSTRVTTPSSDAQLHPSSISSLSISESTPVTPSRSLSDAEAALLQL